MSDQDLVIEIDDDTEGHRVRRGVIETEDTEWLQDRLRRDSGKTSFRVMPLDEDDTEGHIARGGPVVRVSLDDDTEGHAIAIHFPSREEADAFRRRLMVTGVLVGTVALGAAGGAALSAVSSDSATGSGAAVESTVTGSDWSQAERPTTAEERAGTQAYANYQEAAANEGARQGGGAATQAGPMDAHEAPAFQSGATSDAYANYQEAAANEGARQGGGAATQEGPMDAHEAPAFQDANLSAADQAYADRLSGQETQVGPMDAHEAPAFQDANLSAADQAYADRLSGQAEAPAGPMDAHEAPAFQSSTGDDEAPDKVVGPR